MHSSNLQRDVPLRCVCSLFGAVKLVYGVGRDLETLQLKPSLELALVPGRWAGLL